MQLFYQPLIQQGAYHLDGEEFRHIKVLRLKSGDQINITDGLGKIYNATITEVKKTSCNFSINSATSKPKRPYSIHIAIAPTKNSDRIEWFVEKATEIGIDEISFINCKTSERKVVNLDRIQKKAISAIKQSGQAWLPKINTIRPFNKVLVSNDLKFIAHVDPSNTTHLKEAEPNSSYLVLIGPEGDFDQDEIELAVKEGFKSVTLGASILRTETAGLAACHILNLINQ